MDDRINIPDFQTSLGTERVISGGSRGQKIVEKRDEHKEAYDEYLQETGKLDKCRDPGAENPRTSLCKPH